MFRCSGNIPCFNQFTRLLQVVATIFRLRCISVSRAQPWTWNHSSQLTVFTFAKMFKGDKWETFQFFRRVLTSFPSSPKPLQAVSGVQVDACRKIDQFLTVLKPSDQKESYNCRDVHWTLFTSCLLLFTRSAQSVVKKVILNCHHIHSNTTQKGRWGSKKVNFHLVLPFAGGFP